MSPDGDGGLSVGQRIGQLETAMIGIANRVDAVEKRIDRYDGRIDIIVAIGKWVVGTSLVGTAVAIVTLYVVISGGHQ